MKDFNKLKTLDSKNRFYYYHPSIMNEPANGLYRNDQMFVVSIKDGYIHCEDDYAVKYDDGWNYYFYNGIKIEANNLQDFKTKIKLMILD